MAFDIQGWWFLEYDDDRKVILGGQIVEDVVPGVYLCRIDAEEFSHHRVFSVERMVNWAFFPVTTARDGYHEAVQEQVASELREQAVKDVAPKGPTGAADLLALPGDDESDAADTDPEKEKEEDEEATEYGFVCSNEECGEPFECKIAPLPGEDTVRTNCPHCGHVNKKAAA